MIKLIFVSASVKFICRSDLFNPPVDEHEE